MPASCGSRSGSVTGGGPVRAARRQPWGHASPNARTSHSSSRPCRHADETVRAALAAGPAGCHVHEQLDRHHDVERAGRRIVRVADGERRAGHRGRGLGNGGGIAVDPGQDGAAGDGGGGELPGAAAEVEHRRACSHSGVVEDARVERSAPTPGTVGLHRTSLGGRGRFMPVPRRRATSRAARRARRRIPARRSATTPPSRRRHAVALLHAARARRWRHPRGCSGRSRRTRPGWSGSRRRLRAGAGERRRARPVGEAEVEDRPSAQHRPGDRGDTIGSPTLPCTICRSAAAVDARRRRVLASRPASARFGNTGSGGVGGAARCRRSTAAPAGARSATGSGRQRRRPQRCPAAACRRSSRSGSVRRSPGRT